MSLWSCCYVATVKLWALWLAFVLVSRTLGGNSRSRDPHGSMNPWIKIKHIFSYFHSSRPLSRPTCSVGCLTQLCDWYSRNCSKESRVDSFKPPRLNVAKGFVKIRFCAYGLTRNALCHRGCLTEGVSEWVSEWVSECKTLSVAQWFSKGFSRVPGGRSSISRPDDH